MGIVSECIWCGELMSGEYRQRICPRCGAVMPAEEDKQNG